MLTLLKYETKDNQMNQKKTYSKQNVDLKKVIPNNGCDQKLLKVTENNFLVYVGGQSVQKACYMNMGRTATKTLKTKAYALIHY